MPEYNWSNLEKRQDRLEEVIDRLAGISSDLSKMIAVHEQRISQQERQLTNVEFVAERRREEYQAKLDMITDKIEEMRTENSEQYSKLSGKIGEMEKIIWRYGGAAAVIAFILAYGPSILKILSLRTGI